MRTTKIVVVELEAGEVVEVVARVKREGGANYKRVAARLEHESEFDSHSQLRIDISGEGQANILNPHTRQRRTAGEMDEILFEGISIFL